MTSTTANPQHGAFVRLRNSAPLPEYPTQGFCQQPQLGAFANIPNSGLLSESPTRDFCQKYQPRGRMTNFGARGRLVVERYFHCELAYEAGTPFYFLVASCVFHCELACEAGTPLFFAFGCERCFPLRTRPRGRHACLLFLVASGAFHCEHGHEAGTPYLFYFWLRAAPSMGVQQRARAVEHPYSGPLATKSKKDMACRPRGRVRSGKHRLQPKITSRRAGLVGVFAVESTARNRKQKKVACRPRRRVRSGKHSLQPKNKRACRPRRRVRSGNTAQPLIARARRSWSFVPGVGTFGKSPG